MAHDYGLLETNNGLLWGIVAYNFQLLGCPGPYLEVQVLVTGSIIVVITH